MTTFLRTSLLAIPLLWALGMAAFSGSGPAHAQEVCLIRGDAIEQLDKQYGEKVIAQGLTKNGKAIFELFVSDSGSWTAIVSNPAGHSCVIATGDYWLPAQAKVGNPA